MNHTSSKHFGFQGFRVIVLQEALTSQMNPQTRSWEEATLMRQPLFFWYSSSSSTQSGWEVWSKNSLLKRSNVWCIYWGGSPSGGRCVWSRFTRAGGETLNTNVTLVSWKWLTVLWSLHNIIWVCRKFAGTKPRSGVISAVRYFYDNGLFKAVEQCVNRTVMLK